MRHRFARSGRSTVVVAAMFLLAACSSFFAGPPVRLYSLSPVRKFAADLPRRDVRLVVGVPRPAPGLDTSRIVLVRPPVSFDYFADSAWTERAPLLVQQSLLESFENSGMLTALDPDSIEAHPDFVLRTELRHFEAEYRSMTAPPVVRVAIRVRLVAAESRRIVDTAVFAKSQTVAVNDVPHIVEALNEALGRVIGEIVAWTLANPALSAPRR